jgi:DNA-binding beta-propeller fold protein YncE
MTVVASGFGEQSNPSALVIGPTGLGVAPDGTLYVADTLANRVVAVPDALFRTGSAGAGTTLSAGGSLNGPLGLTVAPDGDLITVNGDNGILVDLDAGGRQVALRTLETSGSPPGAGALFGLAIAPHHMGIYFVDDATNTLDLLGARVGSRTTGSGQ